jgi:pimeloyl-ACP methyl ester carboxylesterase
MTPTWFIDNLNHKPTEHFVTVRGASIHYLSWSNPDKPAVMFIHGHAAHAHWWDFIAPSLTVNYNVVAIDLSGAGDSEHRSLYSTEIFAEEIATVIATANLKKVTLVAHSFGGTMARSSCYLFPGLVENLILVDSVIRRSKPNSIAPKGAVQSPLRSPVTRNRYYKSILEGQRRFRLKPPQPCDNTYIIEHISRHSLKKTKMGFAFKLDRKLFSKLQESPKLPDGFNMIQAFKGNRAFIIGEDSHFFADDNRSNIETLRSLCQSEHLQVIPAAHHHVFLDQPQAFISALKTILDRFSHAKELS